MKYSLTTRLPPRDPIGGSLYHRSLLPVEFESLTLLWRSAHLVYHVHESGRKTLIIILWQQFLNIFIDELLLNNLNYNPRVSIGRNKYSAFVCADDVTVFSANIKYLQYLTVTCMKYAIKLKLKFGVNKTKWVIVSENKVKGEPTWRLGENNIENVNYINMFGVKFKDNFIYINRVDSCIQKRYRYYYSL